MTPLVDGSLAPASTEARCAPADRPFKINFGWGLTDRYGKAVQLTADNINADGVLEVPAPPPGLPPADPAASREAERNFFLPFDAVAKKTMSIPVGAGGRISHGGHTYRVDDLGYTEGQTVSVEEVGAAAALLVGERSEHGEAWHVVFPEGTQPPVLAQHGRTPSSAFALAGTKVAEKMVLPSGWVRRADGTCYDIAGFVRDIAQAMVCGEAAGNSTQMQQALAASAFAAVAELVSTACSNTVQRLCWPDDDHLPAEDAEQLLAQGPGAWA